MSNEIADALRRAKALISDPNAWVQGCFAEDADGTEVEPRDPSARSWCAVGAVIKVGDDTVVEAAEGLLTDALAPVVPYWGDRSVAKFNDASATTHGAVMGLFDLAITLAEQAA